MKTKTFSIRKKPRASCTLLRGWRLKTAEYRRFMGAVNSPPGFRPDIGELGELTTDNRRYIGGRGMVKASENDERQGDWSVRMRVRNIDQDPDSLHQRIIADDDLGFTQAIIAQRQGCAQSTVSQVLAAERLRRLRAELGRDADGSDGPETSVRVLHAAEQVKEALAYVKAVEKRLRAVQRLLMADAAADNNGADRAGTTGGRDADSREQF